MEADSTATTSTTNEISTALTSVSTLDSFTLDAKKEVTGEWLKGSLGMVILMTCFHADKCRKGMNENESLHNAGDVLNRSRIIFMRHT